MEKPTTIEEYKKWLKEEHEYELLYTYSKYYENVTNKIKLTFEKSNIWTTLKKNLQKYHDEYLINKGYQLLNNFNPTIHIKPFDSFLLKTFRKNILENKNWPNEPVEGWFLPSNWYSKINDIVRTLLVVKYLDGVEFMIEKIKLLCEQNSLECKVDFEAKEEGYYAAHLYTKKSFDIPKEEWDTKKIDCFIEIQITSQLQEVIRKLLHKYYEIRRKRIKQEDIKWQWDYTSEEFATNYLGHILHYLEGMIVEIRDKQKDEEKI